MPRAVKATVEVAYPDGTTDEEIASLQEGIEAGLMREIGNGLLTNPEPQVEVEHYHISVKEEV